MNIPTTIYLVDTPDSHENLLPLSFTRPVADFRIGITTIRQKWEDLLPGSYNYYPVEYLREKFGDVSDPDADALYITGALLPDPLLVTAISNLLPGQALFKKGTPLAYHGTLNNIINKEWEEIEYEGTPRIITYVFDTFLLNPQMIKEDFRRITHGRVSCPLSDSNRVIGNFIDEEGKPMIFIEEGATV